ncbi:MAG TPA: RidA family protein [Thermoanaerobaculia bacterium]|jgi:enamine deaminase RidA (YjgF/YER057c/UK114 family)
MSGLFVPSVQTGNLIYVSGHIAKRDGEPWIGRLGETMTTAEGQQAARAVAEDLLKTLGDLSRIERIVKVMVLVNSASTFTEQHLVANGASELFIERISEHARSAIGVAQLPYGVCVEIELIAKMRAGN